MADGAPQNILRRKVDAGRSAAPASRKIQPAKVLSTALSKSADASMGLDVTVKSSSERIASLSDLLECLPENGLLALLEGPRDGQGVMAFDSSALSAIIEKQMTGTVSRNQPQSRRVTRTDAALAADLIDATLHRFETALSGLEESRWASGFGYSSHIDDLRPLGLLLEDVDYRIFGLSLNIELGTREGEILLALPAKGRAKVTARQAPVEEETTRKDPDWKPRLEGLVLQGEARLEAILYRFQMPISAIKQLQPGQEIPIPVSTLNDVRIAGAERIPLGRCRLGRCQGHRAIRLGADGASEPGRGPQRDDAASGFSATVPSMGGRAAGNLPTARSLNAASQAKAAQARGVAGGLDRSGATLDAVSTEISDPSQWDSHESPMNIADSLADDRAMLDAEGEARG